MDFPAYVPAVVQNLVRVLLENENLHAQDAECLKRLTYDSRMHDAYKLLHGEFARDTEWQNFIVAAMTAQVDYRKYREAKRAAEELTNEIANAAEKLEKLLRRFSTLGVDGPAEFGRIADIKQLSDAAKNFQPTMTPMIETAIAPRQHNPKNEYVRAFGNQLEEHGFALTKGIMQATAIVATVAINASDIVVTSEDVRKTLS